MRRTVFGLSPEELEGPHALELSGDGAGAAAASTGPRPRTQSNPAGLTARELELLPLLAEGLRNTQIADRLVVSPRTVDHHVSAILGKLGVKTRSQAATEAIRRGLLIQA